MDPSCSRDGVLTGLALGTGRCGGDVFLGGTPPASLSKSKGEGVMHIY